MASSCSSDPKTAAATSTGGSGSVIADGGAGIGGNSAAVSAYTVGGIVTGLLGKGLLLQVNGGNELAIASDGSFQFASALLSDQAFSVTVKAQPTGPSQTCTVSNGLGTLGSANVSNVIISCITNTYVIGGTVTGLIGTGLVLQDNAGDDVTLAADGDFVFSKPVASGEEYVVTIKTQPTAPDQRCTISNGSGHVDSARISDVSVTCVSQATGHKVGGNVVGTPLAGLELANNGVDKVSITGAGLFNFAAPLATGAAYSVTVATQPPLPGHCAVQANGSGTVGDTDVSNVTVKCGLNYTFDTSTQAWGISPGGVPDTALEWAAEGQDATGGALRVTIPYTSSNSADTRVRAVLPADVIWNAAGMTVTEWVRIDAAPTTDWAGNIFVYLVDANGQWNTFCFSMMNFTPKVWRKLSGTLPATSESGTPFDWTSINSVGILVQSNGGASSTYQTAVISLDSVVIE